MILKALLSTGEKPVEVAVSFNPIPAVVCIIEEKVARPAVKFAVIGVPVIVPVDVNETGIAKFISLLLLLSTASTTTSDIAEFTAVV